MKTLNQLFGLAFFCVIVLVGIYFYAGNLHKTEIPAAENVEYVVWADTSEIQAEYRLKLESQIRAEIKPRIIRLSQSVNIDSIYFAAKRYWEDKLKDSLAEYSFIAEADTLVNYKTDSLDISVNIKTEYVSPIPLAPEAYFNQNISLSGFSIHKTKEVTITKIAEESFWDHFNISVQAGFGQGLIHKDFDVFYGLGVSYNIKKLF